MDIYALYTYNYYRVDTIERNLFVSHDEIINMETVDKNLWLDRLFGERNTDVRIQRLNKRGKGADKLPCKVLAHGNGRVVWLRMENEKIRHIWVKRQSDKPYEPDPISQEEIADNPYSYIFLDCREEKNLIAIMKENDAWRNTDIAAQLLQESLNMLMRNAGYGFGIEIKPVTVSKDFWDYNRKLILKGKRLLKKMTIYFGTGTLDPQVIEYINQTPILKRLLKEVWEAKRGKFELEDPLGPRVVDGRKRDIKKIIELIGSNMTNDVFGLSLVYDDGQEVVCGKDVKLMYPMKVETDMFSMLFSQNIFGEYKINDWLDGAVEYIKNQKDESLIESKRSRKNPKHIQETSAALDML